jgi:hypothetical protein
MSESAVRSSEWAELSEPERIQLVRAGQATLKQMVQGLLDGPDDLKCACSTFLMEADATLERRAVDSPNNVDGDRKLAIEMDGNRKRRQGLPEGYARRCNRQ